MMMFKLYIFSFQKRFIHALISHPRVLSSFLRRTEARTSRLGACGPRALQVTTVWDGGEESLPRLAGWAALESPQGAYCKFRTFMFVPEPAGSRWNNRMKWKRLLSDALVLTSLCWTSVLRHYLRYCISSCGGMENCSDDDVETKHDCLPYWSEFVATLMCITFIPNTET
jgi:hypothetical protein